MNIVTVTKMNVARCDWKVTLIKNGKQEKADEIRGDSGQAAAWALNMSAKNGGVKIVGALTVMQIIEAAK